MFMLSLITYSNSIIYITFCMVQSAYTGYCKVIEVNITFILFKCTISYLTCETVCILLGRLSAICCNVLLHENPHHTWFHIIRK